MCRCRRVICVGVGEYRVGVGGSWMWDYSLCGCGGIVCVSVGKLCVGMIELDVWMWESHMCGCGKNSVCECERIKCVCVGVLDVWEWLNSLCGRILYIGVGESHVCVCG